MARGSVCLDTSGKLSSRCSKLHSGNPARHLNCSLRASNRLRNTQTRQVGGHRCNRTTSVGRTVAAASVKQTESYTVTLDTDAARASIRFAELNDGNDKTIVVGEIAKGSPAEEAGVQAGQKVLAVSDPVNTAQMLELNVRPSKRSIQRALQMRASPTIDFVFSQELVPEAEEALQNNESVTERLNLIQRKTAKQVPVSDERAQLLDEYRQEEEFGVSKKKKNNFAVIAGVVFFLIPAFILILAISTGYLDRLGGNYGL